MGSYTTRVGAYQTAADGSDNPSPALDQRFNAALLESGLGAVPVGALPADAFDGKIVNLAGRFYIANGAIVGGVGGTWVELKTVPVPPAVVTLANSTAETIIATATIPAGEAIIGRGYRITASGLASVTGTPTLTLRTRLGGISGVLVASSGARTASSGITSHPWDVNTRLWCVTTGATGTGYLVQDTRESVSVAGASGPWTPASLQDATAPALWNTTTSQTLVITAQWSAASASNTLSRYGMSIERMS